MRFIYILIISLLFNSSLWSQKTFASRALDYSWIYNKFVWTDISGRYTGYIDTTVKTFNGKSYRSFIGDLLNFQIADSGSKVFVLKGSEEILLMDYSLNVSDTLKTGKYQMKIIEKYKVKIENDSLWYIQMKSITNQPPVLWLESIGCLSLFHPINWNLYFGYGDIGYNLNCVVHRDTSILNQFRKNCALDNTLINPNKKWYTWASNHNGDLKFSVPYYFTNRDTLINGKKYQTMNQPMHFVRYDTFSGKYYIVSNKLGEEMMVFNDKAQIGDTIYSTMSWTDKVTHITYQWLQDEYRKVYTTNKDKYISGIGWENRVMWDNHLVTFPEYQAGNICYGEFASIKYHYPFYYQNREQCEITSSIQNANQEAFHIFPNPVKNLLNISSADKKEFRISNSYGALVLKGECEGTIDVAGLTRGIYFLNIQTRDNALYTKFLKE